MLPAYSYGTGILRYPAHQQFGPAHSTGKTTKKTDMRLEKTSTLAEILGQGRLGSLQERSHRLQRLDTLLGFYLDQRLRQLVHVAGYQDGTLLLACANTTVAGQLRYLSRIYMQQLRQHAEFCDIGRIKVVIATDAPTGNPKNKTARHLSPAAATLLRELSDDLGAGEISEALQRLARHEGPAGEGKADRSSRE